MTLLRLFVVVALGLLVACFDQGRSTSSRRQTLELSAVKTVTPPASNIIGGAVVSDSSFLVWNADRVHWLLSGSGVRNVPVLSGDVAMSRLPFGDSGGVGVRRSTSQVVRLDKHMRMTVGPVCPGAAETTDVVARDGHLWLTTSGVIGEYLRLYKVTDSDCTATAALLVGSQGVGATLTPLRDGVLVSFLRANERPLRVERHGDQIEHVVGVDFAAVRSDPTAEIDQRWIALPHLALDAGFLRILAERQGSRRILELSDDRAFPQRFRDVNAPLGLVASDPDRHLILGMQGVKDPVVVIYTWKWASPNTE